MTPLSVGKDTSPPRAGLLLLQALILALFCLFALRLWYLQIHHGEDFAAKARENQIRKEAVLAPRGLLRDRYGKLLAVNEPAYALGLVRENCKDVLGTLKQVSTWTDIPLKDLRALYKKSRRRVKPFEPIILAPDLSFQQMAVIEANMLRWPGLELRIRPRRHYNYGMLMGHILGYVAEAGDADLAKDAKLALGDEVGKQGLELVLEGRLRGTKGSRQFEVDVNGRSLAERILKRPKAGQEVKLSVDVKLQGLIMNWLKGEAGSVVVMDADTGQLLALCSAPSFDSNAFSSGLTKKQWLKLRDDPQHPLQNRAIQSVYPPGSIFKPVIAGAGLMDGINTKETVFCSGAVKLGNREFRCWKKGGHGRVDLERALIESCDTYFYKLGRKLGVDRMHAFADACGFGKKSGIRLPHEKSGVNPSRQWKRKRFGQRWQGGDDFNMSIGQGYTLVTPLQAARFAAAVINGGKMLRPLLLADDKTVVQGTIPLKPDQLALIKRAMVRTVTDDRGTARRLRTKGVTVGGKTGTAQVVRLTDELKALKDHEIPYKYRDHAWMESFAIKGDRKYAIVAMVEHGLHGSSGAGPVVKAVIEYLFNGKVMKPPKKKPVPGAPGGPPVVLPSRTANATKPATARSN